MKHILEVLIAYWPWLPFIGVPMLIIGAAIARGLGKETVADSLAQDASTMGSGSDHQVSS